MKNLKPKFIENSRLPVWLSRVAPIEIWAINLGFWVWCRGELSEETKRHETIHFQQQLEMLFVFFFAFYIFFWMLGLVVYRDAEKAYKELPFEREARCHESSEKYLSERKRFSWVKHIFTQCCEDCGCKE